MAGIIVAAILAVLFVYLDKCCRDTLNCRYRLFRSVSPRATTGERGYFGHVLVGFSRKFGIV